MLVISTVERICTASVLRREVSITFASAIANFSWLIFVSKWACASLAASYSAFSLKSPLSRASAMAAEAFGRSTVSNCWSWATISS